MKVRMAAQMTGDRDGVAWPAPGEDIDLPDAEGAEMCALGLAVPVKVVKEERAVAPAAEKRSPGRPRKSEA